MYRSLEQRPRRNFVFGIAIVFAITSCSQDPRLYTQTQAQRGKEVYSARCRDCHGDALGGISAPALAGDAFGRNWVRDGRTLDDLFFIIRTTMPAGRANTLPIEDYQDVLAYILERNGSPSGDTELSGDGEQLSSITLGSLGWDLGEIPEPPSFIAGERATPIGSGPDQEQLTNAATSTRDWLFTTHDYSGQRYVNVDQINTSNASHLRETCNFQLREAGNFQTSPLVYDGVMYVTTVHATVAINATTCRLIWRHEWEDLAGDVWQNNRGVAIKDGYVIRATPDGYLVALDAADGELLWARQAAERDRGETFTMAPMIYEDLILIGPAGSENAIKGWVGAFRLHDGSPVWRFNLIPHEGEPGYDTWDNNADIPLGGGAVWTPFSLDIETSWLYVAATNPAPDFPAAIRGGDNLYTNSLVALDVRTGELQWYQQMVPADDHDWDLTHASPLYSASVDGVERKFVATVGKDGVLRSLDRVTHERQFETPVTTLENAMAPVTHEGTHACPGVLGGVEWSGPAFNPLTNILYTPAVDWCATFTLADTVRFVEGQDFLGGDVELDDDSQGWITAVDAVDGSVKWKYRSEAPMVGALTTTSGNVLFAAELSGDFMVFDAETGEELYRFDMGAPSGGGIVTYEIGGRQYVAVTAGRPSGFWTDDETLPRMFVFSLPDNQSNEE